MWVGVGSEGFYFFWGGGDHLIFKDNGRGNESWLRAQRGGGDLNVKCLYRLGEWLFETLVKK